MKILLEVTLRNLPLEKVEDLSVLLQQIPTLDTPQATRSKFPEW